MTRLGHSLLQGSVYISITFSAYSPPKHAHVPVVHPESGSCCFTQVPLGLGGTSSWDITYFRAM